MSDAYGTRMDSEDKATHVLEYAALLVNEVDESMSLQSVTQRDTKCLPVRMLRLPLDPSDAAQTAILSWRWDIDGPEPSRNLRCALRQARKTGLRYLLIDIVSIDQRLPAVALIERVAEFAELYGTVQVIAAYDARGENIDKTMRRPWILHEIQIFRSNPYAIIYVCSKSEVRIPYVLECYYTQLFSRTWSSNWVRTIMDIISGEVGMADISDFKYILPTYSQVLTVAFDRMGRNDYLLTAAILCQVYSDQTRFIAADITALAFERYTLKGEYLYEQMADEEWLFENVEVYLGAILLDGMKIATFKKFEAGGLHYSICAEPPAERMMFDTLGFTISDQEAYTDHESLQTASQLLETYMPEPRIDFVFVEL